MLRAFGTFGTHGWPRSAVGYVVIAIGVAVVAFVAIRLGPWAEWVAMGWAALMLITALIIGAIARERNRHPF